MSDTGIKLDIDQDQVQKYITDALIESAVGKVIIEGIEKAIKPSYGNSVVDDAIKNEVRRITQILIEAEYQDQIKEKVKEYLKTEVIIDQFVKDYINRLIEMRWDGH